MHLSEIRLVKGDHRGDSKRFRMTTGQGVTFVYTDTDVCGESPFTKLHQKLVSPDMQSGDELTKEQDAFALPSSSLRENIEIDHTSTNMCDDVLDDFWQFVFVEDERTYRLATDVNDSEQSAFFSQTIVGSESAWLGNQIDFSLLSDRQATVDAKRDSLAQLRERLLRAQRVIHDESSGLGKLDSTRAELDFCQHELNRLNKEIVPASPLSIALENDEKHIAELKAEDFKLAREQRLMTLLARKSEYESLLELRRELKEIEEREGRYGSRITDLGHDITVHELTALAQWRNNAAEIKKEIAELDEVFQGKQQEKTKLEQQRILLSHKIRNNLKLKSELIDEYEYLSSKSVEDRNALIEYGLSKDEKAQDRPFPNTLHFSLLAAFLMLAIGLLLITKTKVVGIVLISLAILTMLFILYTSVFINKRQSIRKSKRSSTKQTDDEDLRIQIDDLDMQFQLDQEALESLTESIADLEREMAQYTIKIETAERQLKNLNDDLLRTIRKYAGPSQIHEIDDIIETLSKQRESSASHNEAVADILRRIADLKHGRSDEEMVREYESVCEQLYGDSEFGSMEDNSRAGQAATMQLRFDALRAKEISSERVEIARLIDEISARIKEAKNTLSVSSEATIAAESLQKKCAMLRDSMNEMEKDFNNLGVSIAWLSQLLLVWDEIDVMEVMANTVRYSGRMSGKRLGDTLPMKPIDLSKQTIRTPGLLEHKITPYTPPISIDLAIFKKTPTEQNYLSLRLALASQHISSMPENAPLILMDPEIPQEYSRLEELINTLEEWTLETGQQIVFFTTHRIVREMAETRKMVVHRLVSDA